METLDISDDFDMHDYRHGLKLIQEDRKTKHLENRANKFACPACEQSFDKLFISEQQTHSFGNPGTSFCIARAGEKMLLLTH